MKLTHGIFVQANPDEIFLIGDSLIGYVLEGKDGVSRLHMIASPTSSRSCVLKPIDEIPSKDRKAAKQMCKVGKAEAISVA